MSIQDTVQKMITGDEPTDSPKTLTVRLPIPTYAKLCVLSQRLGRSNSAIGREFLVSAINEAVTFYLDSTGEDPNDFGSDYEDAIETTIQSL